MSRIIEILLFLAPFFCFAVWRLLFPSPLPPTGLILGLAGFVAFMLLGLLWLRHFDAGDANQSYVPARLLDGRVIPPERAATP